MLLFDKVDVVFISKDFVWFCGYFVVFEVVKVFCSMVKFGVIVICVWGEEGVDGIGFNGEVKYSDVFFFKKVIDMFGVGDIFVVGVIYSFLKYLFVEDVLNFVCKLVGFKCGMFGNNGFVNVLNGSLNSD